MPKTPSRAEPARADRAYRQAGREPQRLSAQAGGSAIAGKKRAAGMRRAMIAIGGSVIVVGVAAGWWLFMSGPPTRIVGTDGSPMFLIPAGSFLMGSTQQDIKDVLEECGPLCKPEWTEREWPQRTIELDAYYIDQFEVTNARYLAFVEATEHRPPEPEPNPPSESEDDLLLSLNFEVWKDARVPKAAMELPVVHVSWEDAKAYCAWAGRRLPTEAEWEKAARGDDGRWYPWGHEWDRTRSNNGSYHADRELIRQEWWSRWWLREGLAKLEKEGLSGLHTPVGTFEDSASPYGVHDMAGNVWEWVQDWYDAKAYMHGPTRNPLGLERGEQKVARGGSYMDPKNRLRVAARIHMNPEARKPNVGFRCAKSLR